jgi:hypothetical protein
MSLNIFGIKIVANPLVTQHRWIVKAHPIPKRRRRWSVERITEPGCWQMGDVFYMHPDLIARLPTANASQGE